MVVVSVTRTRDGELESADTATLSITSGPGVVIWGPTVVTPVSTGVYSQEIQLAAGTWTANWTFIESGYPTDTFSRAFTVDQAIEITSGITLMALERLVARRIGPWYRHKGGVGSSQSSAKFPRLISSLDQGMFEDMYILRRGFLWTTDIVPDFTSDDRIRQVDSYDATTGSITPDSAWTNSVVNLEAVEFHVLHPDDELRPAILEGLARCFFWDTVSISVTGSGVYNLDLTASVPWLKDVNQVREVELSYPSQILPARRMGWWKPYREGRSLKLSTKGGAVGSVKLTVLRPVSTLVNGVTSYTGPNDDLDQVYVDPDYAAWAGVLECWKNYPEILQPLAAQNMRPSREDAATEFTKKGLTIVQQVPEFVQVDYGVPDLVQIGNLAEPV